MIRISGAALSLGVFWLILPGNASAHDLWQEQCLKYSREHDSVFEFDGHPLVVGGRPRDKSVLYCVVVQGATQEYLVNWPEAQMWRVETRNGIVAHSIRISLPITIAKTTLEIGANAKRFNVQAPVNDSSGSKAIDEISAGDEWEAITRLFAALPLADSSGNFRPVDIEITTARTKAGHCRFTYVDYVGKEDTPPVTFQLPEFIWKNAEGAELADFRPLLYGKHDIVYAFHDERVAQPTFAALPIVNDDGKELAFIPFVSCGGEVAK